LALEVSLFDYCASSINIETGNIRTRISTKDEILKVSSRNSHSSDLYDKCKLLYMIHFCIYSITILNYNAKIFYYTSYIEILIKCPHEIQIGFKRTNNLVR